MKLTNSQKSALNYITEHARGRRDSGQDNIDHVLRMSNVSQEQYEEAVCKIKLYARVGLHFHPDRLDMDGHSVAEALSKTGVYKSQFETKISNGGVSAFPGGHRDIWEKDLFGGSYHTEVTMDRERPKYGALNLMLHPDGPAPRFGSCYFLLKPEVSKRCTYTYLDSSDNPSVKGSFDEFTDIMASLLVEIFSRDFALGEKNIMPASMIQHILTNLEKPIGSLVDYPRARNLNHYIEAHVHGDICLKEDVDAMVADPSFKNTPIGDLLSDMAKQYSFELHWHQGFRLHVTDVPSDFRGPKMPSLAERISVDNYIDVSLIGKATIDLKKNPDKWVDRGDYKTVLQELKLLWHVLVKYG